MVSGVLELPLCMLPGCMLRWRALHPMLLQTRGTLLASQLALRTGFAVSLGGGFHHASRSGGHGFCPFNDLTMASDVALGAHACWGDRCLGPLQWPRDSSEGSNRRESERNRDKQPEGTASSRRRASSRGSASNRRNRSDSSGT